MSEIIENPKIVIIHRTTAAPNTQIHILERPLVSKEDMIDLRDALKLFRILRETIPSETYDNLFTLMKDAEEKDGEQ